MSNDPERREARQRQVDDDMAAADRANGEGPSQDEQQPPQRRRSDPEAPGTYVDDDDTAEVAEPNEPA